MAFQRTIGYAPKPQNRKREMSFLMDKTKLKEFKNLTWPDLEEWAGDKIVARGKSYQRNEHVKRF